MASAVGMIPQLSDQCLKHAANFLGLVEDRLDRARRGHSDPLGQQQMGFKLLERALGDAEKVDVGLLRGPTISLGDIGGD